MNCHFALVSYNYNQFYSLKYTVGSNMTIHNLPRAGKFKHKVNMFGFELSLSCHLLFDSKVLKLSFDYF